MKETQKTYEIDGLGAVCVVRSRTARKIRLTIKPDKGLRVTIPWGVSWKEGLRVVEEKKTWAQKHIHKYEEQKLEKEIFTLQTNYRTRSHQLVIKLTDEENFRCHIKSGFTLVSIPKSLEIETQQVQEWIHKSIEETWRIEAKQFLPEKLERLAKMNGFSYSKVTIRNSKTRWGSCSSTGSINLSLHLMRLPEALIDLVINHELVHTIHKNHGAEFHAMLNTLCNGKEKELNAMLRTYKMGDYKMYFDINKNIS